MLDIQKTLDEHQSVIRDLQLLAPKITEIAKGLADCIRRGGKILWMGNGGSAADCQHMAAELVGRFSRERQAIASIALTTDTSILTALGNDYGFDTVFARQIEALCQPGDVVVGISTSGNSMNVIHGIRKARQIGALTVGFTGRDGGKLAGEVELCLSAPSSDTPRIQESHTLMAHIICDWIEADVVATAERKG